MATSAWDDFTTQMSQFFGPLNGQKTGVVNVPGYGPLERTYDDGSEYKTPITAGLSAVGSMSNGEGGGGVSFDPAWLQQQDAAWQQNATNYGNLTESQK